MPQPRVLDFGEDPVNQALYRGASGFGETMLGNLKQQQENDAIKRITENYKPGMDRVEFLRNTLSSASSLPLEKRASIFEALSQAEEQDKKSAKENSEKKKREAFAKNLESEYGIPYDIAITLEPKDAVNFMKQQKQLNAVQKMISDPNFNNMSDQEFLKKANDAGLGTAETKRLDDIRKRSQEIDQQQQLNANQRMTRWTPYIDDLRHKADLAQSRIDSFDEAEALLNTDKVGPQNWRNFIASFLPEGNPLKSLIENPENAAFRTLAYRSLIGTKADFGARGLTNMDVGIVLDKIIGVDKTVEANRAIMNFMRMDDKKAILKNQISQELRRGGKIPDADFDVQVEDEFKKRYALEYEKAARDVMALGDDGKPVGIWMVDPENNERHLIKHDEIKQAEEFGFRRL